MATKKKSVVQAFLSLTPDLRTYLRTQSRGIDLRLTKESVSKETDLSLLDPNTAILAVFVDSDVSKKVITALPNLRAIITLSTGYDHIDIRAAKQRNIAVCNVPTYGEDTVAEYAIGLMLTLSRQLYPAIKSVKEGHFSHEAFRGFDLAGKTIGVVGTGRIGARVIEMLHGFHVRIICHDPCPNKTLMSTFPDIRYVPFSTLCKESDVITLHAPLCKETTHIIDKTAIKKMKPGVCIVNTARGGLIDSKALLWGLETNHVGSAALDVLEEEHLLEDPMLLLGSFEEKKKVVASLVNTMLIDHPRVIVTPHNAFHTTEALKRIIDTSIDNMKSVLDGSPKNDVTAIRL